MMSNTTSISTSTVVVANNNINDNDDDDSIRKTRKTIRNTIELRRLERQRFTDDGTVLCIRQHYCAQELYRMLQKRVATAPCYTRAIKELSVFESPPYVRAQETKLCEALHRIEIHTNQIRILVEYHNNLTATFERRLNEEIRLRQDIEGGLRRSIELKSRDMQRFQLENEATLERQRQQLVSLKAEDEEDVSVSSSTKSVAPMSLLVSGFFRSKTIVNDNNNKMNHHLRVKMTTKKVGSYLGGVFKYAKAA